MFFRYRKYLEAQIEELKTQVKEKDTKIDELVMALVPVLRRMNEPVNVNSPRITKDEKKHVIVRSETAAECACGWTFYSADPARLQTEIESHYMKNIHPIKAGRMSWQSARQRLEETAESNKEESA